MTGINWEDLVIGEHYTAEETYHFQAREVVIVDVDIEVTEEGNDKYTKITFEVVEATHNAVAGKVYTWGRSTEWSHYSKGKFKPLGSMLDYLTPGNTVDDYNYKGFSKDG